MRRRQLDGLAQVGQGVVRGLVGQAVHEVHVEVVEAGCACHVRGADRLVAVVYTPQGLELGGLEALYADGQAIDAGLPVRLEFLLLEGPWVGFQSDFDVDGERDALLHAAQQTPQSLGAEQAWSAAAEEDRADGASRTAAIS